jgi:hypothetical protein
MSSAGPFPTYDETIDFQALAADDPDFARTLERHKGRVDFRDADSVQYDQTFQFDGHQKAKYRAGS